MSQHLNAFEEASKIEKLAVADLTPFISDRALEGRFVFTNKGPLSKELQKTVGDALLNCNKSKVWAIEIKAEVQNKTNNFFLESWSNKSRFTLGWMFTLKADILLYYFVQDKRLFSIPLRRLKKWAFGTSEKDAQIYSYPEKPQKKYKQLNDTWGWCVPISVIEESVGFQVYDLSNTNYEANQ